MVLKIRCTTTLPQVWATFLSPFQGLFPDFTFTQGLRPGLQSVAASRLIESATDHCGKDVTDITAESYFFVLKVVRDPTICICAQTGSRQTTAPKGRHIAV